MQQRKRQAAAISKAQDAQSRDAMTITGKGMNAIRPDDMLDVMDNVGGRLENSSCPRGFRQVKLLLSGRVLKPMQLLRKTLPS